MWMAEEEKDSKYYDIQLSPLKNRIPEAWPIMRPDFGRWGSRVGGIWSVDSSDKGDNYYLLVNFYYPFVFHTKSKKYQ